MTDEYILKKGYKEFKPSPLTNENIVKAFQKRFDDDKGKKYFITIYKWDWCRFHREDMPDYSYELETQLYKKDSHCPLNLTFFGGWTVDDVENHLEETWNSDIYDYYELFFN